MEEYYFIILRPSAELHFCSQGRWTGAMANCPFMSQELISLFDLVFPPFRIAALWSACRARGCHLPHIAPPTANFLSLVAAQLFLFALGTSD